MFLRFGNNDKIHGEQFGDVFREESRGEEKLMDTEFRLLYPNGYKESDQARMKSYDFITVITDR